MDAFDSLDVEESGYLDDAGAQAAHARLSFSWRLNGASETVPGSPPPLRHSPKTSSCSRHCGLTHSTGCPSEDGRDEPDEGRTVSCSRDDLSEGPNSKGMPLLRSSFAPKGPKAPLYMSYVDSSRCSPQARGSIDVEPVHRAPLDLITESADEQPTRLSHVAASRSSTDFAATSTGFNGTSTENLGLTGARRTLSQSRYGSAASIHCGSVRIGMSPIQGQLAAGAWKRFNSRRSGRKSQVHRLGLGRKSQIAK